MGDGTTTTRTTPTLIAGLSNVVAVSAGGYHSVALTESGAVYLWGHGAYGQLGLGTTASRTTPTLLPSLNAVAVFADAGFTAAIRTDGVLVAWGANNLGQLGDGTTTQRLVPTAVSSVPSTALVGLGDNHVIAMTAAGDGWTWGQGTSGQLADGTTTTRSTPQRAFTLPGTWGATPPPVLSLAPGTYSTTQTLGVSHPMPAAVVRYTTDGSAPTESSPELPPGGTFAIYATQVLRFRAWTTTLPPSQVVTAAYTLQPLAPTILPVSGSYTSGQTVSITSATADTTVRYTIDGTEPGEGSIAYAAPFALATTTTVKAKAFRAGWTSSATASATLTFNYGTLDPPVASPGSGTYPPTQAITLTAAPGATIVYTLDGSEPTGSSFVYNTPLTLPTGTTTLKARAYRTDWTPSAVASWTYVSSSDLTPPTIAAHVSPEPNANGWHSGPVTVSFTCEDAESGVASCPGPVTVSWEGEDIAVTREAVDNGGNRASATAVVDVDVSVPYLTLHTPRQTDILPLGTTTATIRGGALDALSGIDVVTCDGAAAAMVGQTYSCDVAVGTGTTTVQIVARDRVGREATRTATVVVGESPAPTSLEITPAKMTVYSGEMRSLHVIDQDGRSVSGGTWTVDQPTIAEVFDEAGRTMVRALAPGTATLTLTRDSLSDQLVLTVLATGVEFPANGQFWELKPRPQGTPLRATVLPALAPIVPDGIDPPAYFFIDEGTALGGSALYRPAGRHTEIRAVTQGGQQVWTYRFNDGIPKQFAADNYGGLLVLLTHNYGGSPSVPARVRRLDGTTGTISWEYLSNDGTLTEFAVHPDGTVYLAEERYHTPGTDFVALDGLTGSPVRHPLPRAETPYPPSTGPIVREDGSVILLFGRDNGTSFEFLTAVISSDDDMVTTVVPATSAVDLVGSRLVPDGQGGLLVAHRRDPRVARFHPDTGLGAPVWLVPQGGWRAGTFETEYVVGSAGGGALIKDYEGTGNRAGLVAFNPVNPIEQLPQAVPASDHAQLRFMLADGTMHVSGSETGIFLANDTRIANGVWGGWSAGPTAFAAYGSIEGPWPYTHGGIESQRAPRRPAFSIFVPEDLLAVGPPGPYFSRDYREHYNSLVMSEDASERIRAKPTYYITRQASVEAFMGALAQSADAVAFIGHSVYGHDETESITSFGVLLSDGVVVKKVAPPLQQVGTPDAENRPLNHIVDRITSQAKIVFVSACKVGQIFTSLWDITGSTIGRALIVPLNPASTTDMLLDAFAWREISRALSQGHTAAQAVAVGNAWLTQNGHQMQFQVIGDANVKVR